MSPHHNLAAAPVSYPSPPGERAEGRLTDSVSATSVSFVACGSAVADLGDLLQDLRLALEINRPPPSRPETQRAAAVLSARLESVRWALDGATAAISSLLEDCDAGPR